MFVRQCSGVKKTGTSIVLNKKCLFQAAKIQVDNVGEALPVFTDRAVIHYEKIYNRDVNILNELIKGTPDEKKSLTTLIMENSWDEDERKIKIFNYASQVYNHGVYVSSLVPFGHPKSEWMTKKLSLHFGSVDQFERVFVMNANGVYGSGWTWLIDNDSNLEVCNGFNSGNPVGRNKVTPLLCVNLWEHAYFPDFRMNRVEYVARWLECVNWAVVEKKLKQLHGDSESDLKSFREFQQNVDNIAQKKLAENQLLIKNSYDEDGEGEDDLQKLAVLRQKLAHQKARQHPTATKTRE